MMSCSTGTSSTINLGMKPRIPSETVLTFIYGGSTTPTVSRFGSLPNSIRDLTATQTHSRQRQQRPRFSIIMTLGGGLGIYWKEAVKSLIDQNYHDWELIFVTDDATAYDNIKQLETDWNLNVKAYLDFHSENRSQRFRRAVGYASGITCAVLDADDLLPQNALRTVNWCLDKYPDIKYFTTSHQVIGPQGEDMGVNVASAYSNTLKSMCDSFMQKHFWGFPNQPKLWPFQMLESPYLCEDFYIFSKLARASTPILPIPNVCYQWRRHMHQMTQRRSDEIERMMNSIMEGNRLFAKGKGPSFALQQMMQAGELTAKAKAMFLPN